MDTEYHKKMMANANNWTYTHHWSVVRNFCHEILPAIVFIINSFLWRTFWMKLSVWKYSATHWFIVWFSDFCLLFLFKKLKKLIKSILCGIFHGHSIIYLFYCVLKLQLNCNLFFCSFQNSVLQCLLYWTHTLY